MCKYTRYTYTCFNGHSFVWNSFLCLYLLKFEQIHHTRIRIGKLTIRKIISCIFHPFFLQLRWWYRCAWNITVKEGKSIQYVRFLLEEMGKFSWNAAYLSFASYRRHNSRLADASNYYKHVSHRLYRLVKSVWIDLKSIDFSMIIRRHSGILVFWSSTINRINLSLIRKMNEKKHDNL